MEVFIIDSSDSEKVCSLTTERTACTSSSVMTLSWMWILPIVLCSVFEPGTSNKLYHLTYCNECQCCSNYSTSALITYTLERSLFFCLTQCEASKGCISIHFNPWTSMCLTVNQSQMAPQSPDTYMLTKGITEVSTTGGSSNKTLAGLYEVTTASGLCNVSLVDYLPDAAITASTCYSPTFAAPQSRMNITNVDTCWAPSACCGTADWLQYDFGTPRQITRIATKGRCGGALQWVTTFYLSSSVNGTAFTVHGTPNGTTVFKGNNDATSTVENVITTPMTNVRFLRIYPVTRNNFNSLKVAVYGC